MFNTDCTVNEGACPINSPAVNLTSGLSCVRTSIGKYSYVNGPTNNSICPDGL